MKDPIPCRFCARPLETTFVDLGLSPLSNSYVKPENLGRPEVFYPLHVFLCDACLLVQLPEEEAPEKIFSDYAYFSSFSDSWLEHCERYAAQVVERFGLGKEHLVMELASNDGYLLQYFKARDLPVLGIEPAGNVAEVAEKAGIPTRVQFFGKETAKQLVEEGYRADLLVGNNVLAHVPDLNDFVAGMKVVLAPGGVITMEFPHLLRLMQEGQFDTIYHEHFSYFSFHTVRAIFAAHGLTLFDVEELNTHGGSLRIYGRHEGQTAIGETGVSHRVEDLLAREEEAGLTSREAYLSFAETAQSVKRGLLRFLLKVKEERGTVVGYGAPAKGNTLLNYCGIREDFLDYTVDRSPHKQGCFLPGTRIPIYEPERILETKPDYVLILPWNLKGEIVDQMAEIRSWGGQFVVAVPEIDVL
ncbi:MAG: class I SAM-dependent methyltransferase [Deltaproteobacteria bacterium]|nr:class I SAM-dependent methyltransferase [Deltaproteobacteria bacterium]